MCFSDDRSRVLTGWLVFLVALGLAVPALANDHDGRGETAGGETTAPPGAAVERPAKPDGALGPATRRPSGFELRLGFGGTTASVDDTFEDYSVGLGVAAAFRARGNGPWSLGLGARFFAGTEIFGGEAIVGSVAVSPGFRLLPALDVVASLGVTGTYVRREYFLSEDVDVMTDVGLLVGGGATLRVYEGASADLALYLQHDRTVLSEAPSFMTNTFGLAFAFH